MSPGYLPYWTIMAKNNIRLVLVSLAFTLKTDMGQLSLSLHLYHKNYTNYVSNQCDQTFSAVITKRCAEILPN
jgi:hypothetical protein